MTYDVFSGTLNPTYFTSLHLPSSTSDSHATLCTIQICIVLHCKKLNISSQITVFHKVTSFKSEKYLFTGLVESWYDPHHFTGPQRYHNVTSHCVHRVNALHFAASPARKPVIHSTSPITTLTSRNQTSQ